MGMFDTLIVKCPNCGKKTDVQTKAGPCMMDVYKWEEDNLPIWLMNDLDNTTEICYRCSKLFRVKFGLEVQVTDKSIEPADNLDYVAWIEKKRKKKDA